MNLYELQDFLKTSHPNKEILYNFDEKCIACIELSYAKGLPCDVHHVEYRLVRVIIDQSEPQYYPISPHREATEDDRVSGLIEVLRQKKKSSNKT